MSNGCDCKTIIGFDKCKACGPDVISRETLCLDPDKWDDTLESILTEDIAEYVENTYI